MNSQKNFYQKFLKYNLNQGKKSLILGKVKYSIQCFSNIHRPNRSSNVFLFSTPRSGPTWLMELICSQPGFKCCDEPLNLRNPLVRKYLGIKEWYELYQERANSGLKVYFQGFINGRFSFMNPIPIRKYYRPFTCRIIFKIIHGCEDRINWFKKNFNGRIIFLVRHPIAVALSRRFYPRLEVFLNSDFGRHFTKDMLSYSRKVLTKGTELEKGVLSWCLQNYVPLKNIADDWIVVSYEQMVMDPIPAIRNMSEKLELPKPGRMIEHLFISSPTKKQSDSETQQLLEKKTQTHRDKLIKKWKHHVNDAEEKRAMQILSVFGLNVYQYGNLFPSDWFWMK